MVFVQRTRIRGLAAFALPLFTLILAWGICASAWTYEPFSTPSMWNAAHMFGVYVGSLFCFLAAASGGMYLYVERRLRRHRRLAPMASLEAIESLNIRTAAVAFSMISIGLVTGLIIVSGKETLVAGWWYSPKIVLAAAAWLAYAVVMNVRFATAFRGTRAAWLSIAGLLLLVATFGVVKSLEPVGAAQAPESAGVETVLVLSGAGTGAGVGVGSMERRRT